MGHVKCRRVLLVDNSEAYRRSLRSLLELEEYQVDEAASVEEARDLLAAARYALALVDLRLLNDADEYDFSGLQVAKAASEADVPCLIITAFPTVEVTRQALRSRGLRPLALDMIPKSGGPQAVLDAIQVVCGTEGLVPERPAAGLEIDLARGLVEKAGASVPLSSLQYALLAHLYRRRGAVCSPEELLKAVYDEDVPAGQGAADKRLERLVDRVREKIEDDASQPRYLKTVHGRGYRLDLT